MKLLSLFTLLLALSCQTQVLNLSDTSAPLAKVHVHVVGNVAALQPPGTEAETPHLYATLVWAGSTVSDAFCLVYQNLPTDPSATAVANAGCRDIFAVVPAKVSESAPVDLNGNATIEVQNLPSANVLHGDISGATTPFGRVGWATIVIFDDRNGNGVLDLRRVQRQFGPDGGGPGGPGGAVPVVKADFIYGASFRSVNVADTRVAYLEGEYDTSRWFYPRSGCSNPPDGFSLVSAGGFGIGDFAGFINYLQNTITEDASTCRTESIGTTVNIALESSDKFIDIGCSVQGGGGFTGAITYDQPPEIGSNIPGELSRTWACVSTNPSCLLGIPIPGLDCKNFDPNDRPALAIASVPGQCHNVTHWILKGCRTDPNCSAPEWDFSPTSSNPTPTWWPCGGK